MGRASPRSGSCKLHGSASKSPSQPKKRLYWYSRLGRIEITEQLFTRGKGKGIARPFSEQAGVHCRGYSLPLQRVITDFGADIPFGQIPQKLQEHHGISVPVSSAQAITQCHAQQVLTVEQERLGLEIPSEDGVACLIVEIDGSMIPTVTTEASQDEAQPIDRRKTRQLGWQEARLGLSRRPEDTKPIFAATFGLLRTLGDRASVASPATSLGQLARMSRLASRSRPARPNICRLSIFRRLFCPSTCLLLPSRGTPALTAS